MTLYTTYVTIARVYVSARVIVTLQQCVYWGRVLSAKDIARGDRYRTWRWRARACAHTHTHVHV